MRAALLAAAALLAGCNPPATGDEARSEAAQTDATAEVEGTAQEVRGVASAGAVGSSTGSTAMGTAATTTAPVNTPETPARDDPAAAARLDRTADDPVVPQ